jgi:hypothetical protein
LYSCNILQHAPIASQIHPFSPHRHVTSLFQPNPEINLSASLDLGVPLAVLLFACFALPLSLCGCLHAKPLAHVEVRVWFSFSTACLFHLLGDSFPHLTAGAEEQKRR